VSAALGNARSFLFVPGDRPERLAKALASGAHAVVVDLEDAVAPSDKAAARAALLAAWPALSVQERARLVIRTNAVVTAAWADDAALLRELSTHGLAGVMVAKSESVAALDAVARDAGGAALLPLVESTEGVHEAGRIARAAGVIRLVFGHLDFQLDLGLYASRDETELDSIRLALVMASRRAGLAAPVDGVTVDLDDPARLAADAARSRRLGFGAKLCIHPRQVAAVNEALGPSDAERQWAQRVLDASRDRGTGAFRLDGRMIDEPVLAQARRVLQA
jgi:citrate lyase subunit beta / citryl-CoA lyase